MKRIAVLDPNNSLKPFLHRTDIVFEEFHSGLDPSVSVFVSRTVANKPSDRRLFADLKKFVTEGDR